MKRLKKIMAGIIMVTLLIITVTVIPSTSMEVQAASVGKVTGVNAVYTKGKTVIKWKRAYRAKRYEIYRSTNGKKYQKVKTVNGLSWKDSKKGEFWYKIRAINGRQRGAFSSPVSVYTIGGRISLRQTGDSFLSAGNSVFALEIWNYASKKPAFIGCTNNGRKMTNFPVYIYNKQNRRYERSLTNEAYYHGALSTAAGETDIKYSILRRGRGNYIIYVSGLGMIYPYVNAYDNSNIYTYYINTYFKLDSRKYRLRVSSNSSYHKDYQVQRVK